MNLKCKECKHNAVCSKVKGMELLNKEIQELISSHDEEQMKDFVVSIDCKHYLGEYTPQFPIGTR